MVDLSAYKGIVFDMDGTLIDSMGAHIDAWKATCEAFGYPFDADYMYGLGGVPTRNTVKILNEKFGVSHSPDEVAQFKRNAWLKLDHTPELIAETIAVFHHYRPSLKIGIGTGAERRHAEQLLDHHGLLSQIDALVTASDVTHGKPHPETFLTVAQKIGVEPADCVVFEDTEIGLQAAKSAGMDCILVQAGKIQR
ncbi:beta-phosphoglucomutase family hydrolase [Alteromonas pelagimontana]|uniref:Beta-phosphoglucomutase family hydrolase n=1 Tax=Alteromonas pelagimontana TaxID=1858656 RepID=A0A6M4MDR3_9ALTE|nr:beta-phosphoglucomutase family hydrolase [Alteromonas pelagimontana]QJR81243.1 beta-phosphoglucomutase family hydrolase [Alteromonas pelagimontana]